MHVDDAIRRHGRFSVMCAISSVLKVGYGCFESCLRCGRIGLMHIILDNARLCLSIGCCTTTFRFAYMQRNYSAPNPP